MLKKLLRDIGKMLNGTVIAQLFPLAVLPILSRLYTLNDFADYALFLSICTVASIVFSMRLELAIINAKFKGEISAILYLSGLCLISFATVALFIGVGIITIFDFNFLWLYLFALSSALFLALFNLYQNYLIRYEKYSQAATLVVVRSLLFASTSVGFGYISNRGQVYAFILSYALISLFIFLRMKKNLNSFSWLKIKYVVYKYKKYFIFVTPHATYNMLIMHAPIYILTVFYSSTIVGLYSMTYRLLAAPIGFISLAAHKVIYQRFSQLVIKKDFFACWKLMKKLLILLSLLMACIFSFFIFFGDFLIPWVLGQKWAECYAFLVVLSPWLFIRSITGVFSFAPLLKELQGSALLIEIIYGIIVFSILFVCSFLQLNIFETLRWFSIFGFIIVSGQLVWYCYLIRETYHA